MKLIWWRDTPTPSVVADVGQQASEAAELARIAGQQRLTDPRTNPAVRGHADKLRDDQHRRSLDAEHGRIVRRHRVEDSRASHAEQALRALQEAREASSPAKSVLALHAGRTRFLGVSLAASLTLSAGSAMGVERLAVQHGAQVGSGYIAEIGLTGLTTAVILYRSHLAQHGRVDRPLTKLQNLLLWLLMIAPLTGSVTANAVAAGAVGVFCSIGAAAFSLFSYIIADASAASIRDQADRVTDTDENRLQTIAVGDDLFAGSEDVQVPATWFEVQGLRFTPARFTPQVQVHAEVHEPVQQRVHDRVPEVEAGPESAQKPAPRPEPEPEPQKAPEPPAGRTTKPRKPANLSDRAAKKATEVQDVVNLIHELGYDVVKLDLVKKRFGFTHTTAYNRLTEARELVNQKANQKAVNQ